MNKIKSIETKRFTKNALIMLLIMFFAISCTLTPGETNSREEQEKSTQKKITIPAPAIPLGTEVVQSSASDNPGLWELVFSDEFNYSGKPDSTKWTYDIGIGVREDGWGSWEAQYYTDNLRNASVENGYLKITAIKEEYGSIIPETGADHRRSYTSARLITRGKAELQYGRYEFRVKLPSGRGTWPAIWMLGSDYNAYNWPACGEIDIVEHVGTDPDGVLAGIHCTKYNHLDHTTRNHTMVVPTAETVFHDYALEWDSEKIEAYIDGVKHFTFYNEHTGEDAWPFDKPFDLILNIAVGGGWGGYLGIDDSIFPQSMLVDYVRYYRKKSGTLENLVLPANGGVLESFTSEYGSGWYAADLTDGIKTDDGWSSSQNPGTQEFVYSFSDGGNALLNEAVIHSGTAEGIYFSRNVQVWTSADGTGYTFAADGTLAYGVNSIRLDLGGITACKVKLVVTGGYRSDYWELGEFEVYGSLDGTKNPPVENVVMPANGGILEYYTSQYGSGWVASDLTNGIVNEDGWSSTKYPGPQEFIYSFRDGKSAVLKEAVLYSGLGEGAYFSRNVEVWVSANGYSFSRAATGSLAYGVNSITLALGDTIARKVKLVITSGYRSDYWELGEFVVNGVVGEQ